MFSQLDAFNGPNLQKTNESTTKALLDTKLQLDNARQVCGGLEDQLIEKDAYYSAREKDLQELHRCEITKGNFN